MSGPWDRPPSSNPDDRDWPAEDLEPRSSAEPPPVEPWSADDPWQERRDPSSGWDEWPPQAPAPDDYTLEEPDLPSSDPWAESWTEEVPGIPEQAPSREFDSGYEQYAEPAAAYEATPTQQAEPAWSEPAWSPPTLTPLEEREPETTPVEEAEAEPEPTPAQEAEAEPEPTPAQEAAAEPPWSEPEPIGVVEPEAEPMQEAEPFVAPVPEAPHIEPWSPEPDPWGAAWTMPEPVAEPVAEAPSIEAELEVEAEPEPEVPAEEPEAEPEPEAELAAELPGAVTEIEPEPAPPAEVPEAEPAEAAEEPEAEPAVAAEEPEFEPDVTAAAAVAAGPEAAPIDDWPAAQPETAEPGAGAVIPAAAAAASVQAWQADIGLAPGPEPAAESEPDAETESPVWTAEPATAEEAPAEEPPAEPAEVAAAEEAEGAGTGDEAWEADLWAEPETAAPEAPIDEPEIAAPAALEADESDAAAAAAAIAAGTAVAAAAPGAADADEVPWPERGDRTEVLPTTWAPQSPPPAAAEATTEPVSGEIRTRLGRGEPQPEEELGEEPNTAEAAVPWLIGVILLLAGMVIVLLALIFAGDASLGGAGGGTPSPSAAGLVPPGSGDPSVEPSQTPRPTTSTSPEASAEPSASAAAVPEYGDLEMIYQGRSAALAPIYLLRRDFTVEGEPEVLAQDADLDVRRFAWSPDGTLGAFLYADLMVGIDPGVDVHALTDGIVALTFGDDAKTVYAVRVGADGGNDVAAILSIDQATGEERELDRVTYPRPNIGEEAALAEAQFSDDGGSVRLFWMEEGGLRLWILGGGAWNVHPTDGNATGLEDDELPVLWAPDGERRIGLAPSGSETTLRMVDRSGDELATTTVTGRVSHLRWSPRGDQVVFTLGRSAPGGGIVQNLYLWNLGEGEEPAPVMITNTGAAFGAEWRGSQNRWEDG